MRLCTYDEEVKILNGGGPCVRGLNKEIFSSL